MARDYPPRSPSDFEEALWGLGYARILAIDEVGRGAVAGPITAAGVLCTERVLGMPWIDRVRDSKKLSARVREMVADGVAEARIPYFVSSVSWRVIDERGLEAAWRIVINDVIYQCRDAGWCDFILIDGPRCPVCHRFNLEIPWLAAVHGDDRHFSVSLASIVAKVARDRQMKEYHREWPAYNFAGNKGYLTDAHIRALGMHGMSPLHRRTWVAVTRAVRLHA